MSDQKEIRWAGSSYDDSLVFPNEPRRCADFQLDKVQDNVRAGAIASSYSSLARTGYSRSFKKIRNALTSVPGHHGGPSLLIRFERIENVDVEVRKIADVTGYHDEWVLLRSRRDHRILVSRVRTPIHKPRP